MLRSLARQLFTVRCALLALCLGLMLAPAAASSATKRIYIANDDHTDYFWTADDAQYRSSFLTMLDYYLTQAEQTAGNAADSRGKFNCDGSLWVWEYERNKTASEVKRLFDHIRAGDISMPLNTAVLCYGGMPAEAVLRSMYYAGRLERRENTRFPLVAAMENQTLPGGVASLWAGSGALYSWRGVCGCATRTVWGNRPREIYHFQGPDGASVCMKWNTMRNGNESIGGYAEARDPSQHLDERWNNCSRAVSGEPMHCHTTSMAEQVFYIDLLVFGKFIVRQFPGLQIGVDILFRTYPAYIDKPECCVRCHWFTNGPCLKKCFCGDGFFRLLVHDAVRFGPGNLVVVNHGDAHARHAVALHP